jgi:hypothetical protein
LEVGVLERALALIAQGVGSVDGLAEKLGVPADLARQLIADLARLGYLRPASAGCGVGCKGCAMAGTCSGFPPMWSLTEKGKRSAATA